MAKKKSAWQQSEFGQINAVTIFNAFYHTIPVFVAALCGYLALGRLPNTSELIIALGTAISAFGFSIYKGMKTNSKGQPFTKE